MKYWKVSKRTLFYIIFVVVELIAYLNTCTFNKKLQEKLGVGGYLRKKRMLKMFFV